MSMPGYIVEALLYFQHINDNNDYINNTYGPSPYTAPVYGRKAQMAKVNNTDLMNKNQIKLLQHRKQWKHSLTSLITALQIWIQ